MTMYKMRNGIKIEMTQTEIDTLQASNNAGLIEISELIAEKEQLKNNCGFTQEQIDYIKSLKAV